MVQHSDQGALQEALERIVPRGATIMWDFDGVVADTEPIHERSYRELLQPHGIELPQGYFAEMIGRTEPEIWERLTDAHPMIAAVDSRRGLIEARQDWILDEAADSLRPAWFTGPALQWLASRGHRSVVVSNGRPATIGTLLAVWDLDIDMPSEAESQLGKAGLVAQLCSAGPAVVIEDNGGYLKTAVASGAVGIGVRHALNTDADLSWAALELPMHAAPALAPRSRPAA